MTVIATAGNPAFSVSRVDVDRDGPTYTIDTLRDLRAARGRTRTVLHHRRRRPRRHPRLARRRRTHSTSRTSSVSPGRDTTLTDPGLPAGAVSLVEVPALAISSSDCRARVAAGRPIWYLVPDGVVSYITKRGLYRAARGAVTEPTDPPVEAREEAEAAGWLHFVRSRAGERLDRQAARRERRVLLGVLVLVLAVVVGAVLWQPWGGGSDADTGDEALGADRVPMLLQVQGANGATASAVLVRDRRGKGSGAVVPVPASLGLPVEGTAAATVRSALDDAGPTLSREALGELIGVALVGSWVLTEAEFATLVDRLGGLRIGGSTVDGQGAVTRAAASAAGTGEVLGALVGGFPTLFSAATQLLSDLGVLAAPGLPVPRLAAVLCGLARESAEDRLTVTTLPVDASGARLDPRAAGPVVRDVLGGRARGRSGRRDAADRGVRSRRRRSERGGRARGRARRGLRIPGRRAGDRGRAVVGGGPPGPGGRAGARRRRGRSARPTGLGGEGRRRRALRCGCGRGDRSWET